MKNRIFPIKFALLLCFCFWWEQLMRKHPNMRGIEMGADKVHLGK